MASSRLRYVVIRSLQTVALLWFILTFLFLFFRLMPGSFTDVMLARGADTEAVAHFEETWGLNDPLYVQYVDYLVNFLHLDMGMSFSQSIPVVDYVAPRLFNSFILVAPAITVGYVVGTILGAVLGNKRGSRAERGGIIGMIGLSSFPAFFLGIMGIIVFANYLGVVPTSGMLSIETQSRFAEAPWWRPYFTQDFLVHYLLPFGVISLRQIAQPGMVMRTSVVEVMNQDFSYYHRITGIPYGRRLRHIGKHAILPVITLYPVSLTRAISGLVVLEFVFNWPGIGNTLVQAVFARDLPTIQFIFFLTAAFVVIANFAVDIFYGVIDPRVSITD